MRVYFLSCTPAAIKLNGMFLGTADCFERHVNLDPADGVFVEVVPYENLLEQSFLIDEKFFLNPPPFLDLYFMGEDCLIYIREYPARDIRLNVICQTRFCGNLVTVFSQGGINLSFEGETAELIALPKNFYKARAEEKILGGKSVLAVFGSGYLLILSDKGKTLFLNPVENAEFNDLLTVTAAFETCHAAKAECTFAYDGERLSLVKSKTYATAAPDKGTEHFAFFESILTGGNAKEFLCDAIKDKADDLKGFLGNFVRVTIPTEKFYLEHGNIAAAGLVYPKSANLYEVKYFAVEYEGGKISNIFEVES